MTFIGVVRIQCSIRPGVPEAVEERKHAGVVVRIVTGDSVVTAKAIAIECVIYTDYMAMEGPEFRQLSDADVDAMLPRLHVLARSSHEDKRVLVTRLRSLGQIVAVTGQSFFEESSLFQANCECRQRHERWSSAQGCRYWVLNGHRRHGVAKEASAFILMYVWILKALMWGRFVNDVVQKLLQF
jgi:Ca2+-transporting ATPase